MNQCSVWTLDSDSRNLWDEIAGGGVYGFSLWAMNGCLVGREGRMFSCVWRMDFILDCSLEIWGL